MNTYKRKKKYENITTESKGNVVEIAFEHVGGEGRGGRGFKKD